MELASVTVSGTSCRKHRQGPVLAQWLFVASSVLFFGRLEHAASVFDIKEWCLQQGRARTLLVSVSSRSYYPSLKLDTEYQIEGAFSNKTFILSYITFFLFYLLKEAFEKASFFNMNSVHLCFLCNCLRK